MGFKFIRAEDDKYIYYLNQNDKTPKLVSKIAWPYIKQFNKELVKAIFSNSNLYSMADVAMYEYISGWTLMELILTIYNVNKIETLKSKTSNDTGTLKINIISRPNSWCLEARGMRDAFRCIVGNPVTANVLTFEKLNFPKVNYYEISNEGLSLNGKLRTMVNRMEDCHILIVLDNNLGREQKDLDILPPSPIFTLVENSDITNTEYMKLVPRYFIKTPIKFKASFKVKRPTTSIHFPDHRFNDFVESRLSRLEE